MTHQRYAKRLNAVISVHSTSNIAVQRDCSWSLDLLRMSDVVVTPRILAYEVLGEGRQSKPLSIALQIDLLLGNVVDERHQAAPNNHLLIRNASSYQLRRSC